MPRVNDTKRVRKAFADGVRPAKRTKYEHGETREPAHAKMGTGIRGFALDGEVEVRPSACMRALNEQCSPSLSPIARLWPR